MRYPGVLAAVASLLVGAFAPTSVQAFELAGFSVGQAYEQFASSPRFQCEAGRTSFADKTCRLRALDGVSLSGAPVEFMTFLFLDNRLYAITATFNPQRFTAVSKDLRKRYGEPAGIAPSNSAGSDTEEWKQSGAELLLRKTNMMGRADARLWSPTSLEQAMKKASASK